MSAAALRALAANCRTLATRADMENIAVALNEIALDYDRQAGRADQAERQARALPAARAPIAIPPSP